MKSLLLVCVGIFSTVGLTAQIAGPLSGSTFGNAPFAGSNQTWTNVGNVGSSDNLYASFGNLTGGTGSHTDYLTVTNFGFNIPLTSTINGMVVEIERSDPNFRTSDASIRIIKGGVFSTTDRSSGTTYPFSDSYQTYGNPADLWGETWAAADINSSNFGIAIAAQRNSSGGLTGGQIDHVRITVFYDFIVLPLKLLDFSLQKNAGLVRLNWITAEESNMNHFEIERSENGRDFVSIGTMVSRNQFAQNSYFFDDKHPLRNISYYRLKMIGNNGNIKFSKIISLQFSSGSTVSLFPIPFRRNAPLNIVNPNNEKLIIQFFSESGQLIGSTTTTSNLIFTNSLSTFKGLATYKVYNEKSQVLGTGKLIVD